MDTSLGFVERADLNLQHILGLLVKPQIQEDHELYLESFLFSDAPLSWKPAALP